MQHNYPIPEPADDPRFSFVLVMDADRVLRRHGYPALTGPDLVRLQTMLFQFLYEPVSSGDGSGPFARVASV